MKASEVLIATQTLWKNAGLYTGALDGIPGPKTSEASQKLFQNALDELHANNTANSILTGTKGNFKVEVIQGDLWVRNVRATCFGGSGDDMDSGETASGFSTKGHPSLKAVSLPMNYNGPNSATKKALSGSPIPWMPFGLHSDGSENHDGAWVEIFFGNGAHEVVPTIDLGPNIDRFPNNGIDCTIALARVANPRATANNFEAIVSYRIIDGVRFI
jgi:peptidoglycan hydrolase-like protein with peptidoglycan-binding domain